MKHLILCLALASTQGLFAATNCVKAAKKSALNFVRMSYPESSGSAKVFSAVKCYQKPNEVLVQVDLKQLANDASTEEHRSNSKYLRLGFDESARSCVLKSVSSYDFQPGIGYIFAYGDCSALDL